MIEGRTRTGFEFSVDEDIIRDMEFVELAAEAQDNGLLLPRLIEMVVGKEQKKAMYDHVRNENGRVLMEKVNAEFEDVIEAIKESPATKNSLSLPT